MTTASELRAEAQHLRALARLVSDPAVLREIQHMIEALDRRVRAQENGGTSN